VEKKLDVRPKDFWNKSLELLVCDKRKVWKISPGKLLGKRS
jgi:hypothetical protein